MPTKTIIVRMTDCVPCPWCVDGNDGCNLYCEHPKTLKRTFMNQLKDIGSNGIPKWCPLKDGEVFDDSEDLGG